MSAVVPGPAPLRRRAFGAVATIAVALLVWLANEAASATAAVRSRTVASASGVAIRPPALGVTAAVLSDANTGQLLYGSNVDAEHAIASTTKLMTALIVLEHDRLSTIFTEPNVYYPSVDSQIGLAPGERMSVHDLLLAMLLPSADDAAEDLAFNTGHRSVARFVGMMNARAGELGLNHTHYSTPSGLDTPGNYSSARDLAKLAAYVTQHQPWFARAVALPAALLRGGAHRRFVVNRNDLVGRIPLMTGIKTGHTLAAGYVLVGSGTRDGMSLISVVLGTVSEGARDANTLALLNYGFGAFHVVEPIHAGAVIARPTVRDRPGTRVDVIAARAVQAVVSRADRIRLRIEMPSQLVGPLKRHAVVGRVVVLAAGRTLAVVPLLLAKTLPAVSAIAIATRFVTRPGILALLAVLVLAVAYGVRLARGRARELDREPGDGRSSAERAAARERRERARAVDGDVGSRDAGARDAGSAGRSQEHAEITP